jgi:hypothetical protein
MRRQENIYVQTSHSCVRNKDIVNVNTSSDICEFKFSNFIMSGATNVLSGLTSSSDSVHIIDGESNIELSLMFTTNTSDFENNLDLLFKFDLYKLNEVDIFNTPPVYSSNIVSGDALYDNGFLFEELVPINSLNLDGEYILKGNFSYPICTDILNRLGLRHSTGTFKIGLPYGNFNDEFDYYFVAINNAYTPIFNLSPNGGGGPVGSLSTETFYPSGHTVFVLSQSVNGVPIVVLNGLTLTLDEDYELTNGNTITLLGSTYKDDILTIIFIAGSVGNGLQTNTILINGITPSGGMNGEGDNLVYFNTDAGKYEVFTQSTPIDNSNVVIILNGVTLANNIDFYQSTTNPKRFILEGSLLSGDVITIIYNSFGSYVGPVTEPIFDVNWTIENAPIKNNGIFTLQLSDSIDFTTILFSATTEYEVSVKSYDLELEIVGNIGDKRFYRVINQKNYVTLSGDIIESIAYSEVIPITINTNSLNSY